ncbi:MAG TPA: hypothetical protein VFL58_06495 [Gaiellaceae bacterium]|nr:hypothetical protein [Gaiellaceae bacterium]
MRRIVCLTILLLFAVVAVPAAAKEGARARLLTALPLHAKAGTPITVKWTVKVRANGKLVPFLANGMFVRLIGKGAVKTAFTRQFGPPYRARIRVPRGGIRGIKLGLMGYADAGRQAPEFFPIVNSPFPTP